MKECEGAGLSCCESCTRIGKERPAYWDTDRPVLFVPEDNEMCEYCAPIIDSTPIPPMVGYVFRNKLYSSFEDIVITSGVIRHTEYPITDGGWSKEMKKWDPCHTRCSYDCDYIYHDYQCDTGSFHCILGHAMFKKSDPGYHWTTLYIHSTYRTLYPTQLCEKEIENDSLAGMQNKKDKKKKKRKHNENNLDE